MYILSHKNQLNVFLEVGVAALFYIPRALWLIMEGGLMKFLTRGVSGRVVEDATRKREMLVKTFQGTNKQTKRTHNDMAVFKLNFISLGKNIKFFPLECIFSAEYFYSEFWHWSISIVYWEIVKMNFQTFLLLKMLFQNAGSIINARFLRLKL